MLSVNFGSYNPNIALNRQNSRNEVLGYKVDNKGYFTSAFNEAAGIPKDYKIHSSTMQSFLKTEANGTFQSYKT